MQQRSSHITMEDENEGRTACASSRGRQLNSKLKVLVRSHAMREETSPPREPSPNHLVSPCIKVIPSSETFPADLSPSANPMAMLSPTMSRVASPCRSPVCVSPTSTLVPSPNSRNSPQNFSPQHGASSENDNSDDIENVSSPKYLNRLNKQNSEKDFIKRDSASHLNNKKRYICDCSNQNCIKCAKNQERNINNNLTNINNNVVGSSNTLTVNRVSAKGKLRQQSSSQGSFEGSLSNSPCLSRDSSSEQQYTDTSGIDLEQFIPETLNRNAKDRAFMLRIEQELVNLAKDKIKTHYKFPPMSSYQRMLVHRCAAYFGMEHNIESSGKCVVVNKTKSTRVPDVEFKDHIKEDIVFSEEPRRSILKRDSNSMEDYNFKSPDRQYSMENRRSKSIEEREEAYEKVRRRIFNREMHDSHSQDDFEWAEIPWSSESDNSRFRLQLPDHNRRHTGKLIKVLSEETGETHRPYVAKSYSFGGYAGVLHRGDSIVSTHSAGPRLLTKQDSGASSVSWRLSPSSSGYKSQSQMSQMSESVTPSPTSTPHPVGESTRQNSSSSDNSQPDKSSGESAVVWAITDLQNVPKGCPIINPQTGETIKNDDGSLYLYDPNNPPREFVTTSKPPPSPKKNINSPQRNNSNNRCQSPRKRSSKYSPSHKSHLTNSSTSPSLPYSPPLPPPQQQQHRNFQFISGMGDPVPQQQFPSFNPAYPPPAVQDSVPVYQQPCIVYTTPYGLPVSPHFEGRMDQQMPEVGNTYYMSIPENSSAPPTQSITYQPPPSSYWQPPYNYYQNTANSTPPQRFPIQVHSQAQQGFMSAASYPQNYLPAPNQQPAPNDLVPVFPHQQVQVVYSTQPNQTNPVMYPNQPNIVYTQNPLYSNQVYSTQNLPQYPPNAPTPNSCTSSVSQTAFTGHMQDVNHQNIMQLTQNMAQMTFVQNPVGGPPNHPAFPVNKIVPSFDIRQKNCAPKGTKFNAPKPFFLGSSQSSTGTSSPAATVVAAGYGPQTGGLYRTPPETPPNQFGYGPSCQMPSVLFRQMNNIRANTPCTNKSSRSPTPASDISHFDKQRLPLPSTIYQGMPYVIQPSDSRIVSGRGQPNAYRQPPPLRHQSFSQSSDSRSHKNRKSKGGKPPGPPSNGKPL